MNFKEELQKRTGEIEEIIKGYLPEETGFQKTVLEAVNYSVLAGGKRLRPMLMQETCRMFGGEGELVKPFMAAIEMIHTYSLVHDDLPAMDNDEYRRGKKTTHAVYGEAMGILAGDALLNLAFETAAEAFAIEVSSRTARAMQILARKAGIYGMIGGQVVDVESEGQPLSREKLNFIYRLKTSALIEASMMIGAVLAGASDEELAAVERVAGDVGLAFQIQDDILDVEGSEASMGKPAGSDEKNQKTTYVTLEGMDKAKKEVERLSREAAEDLDKLGSNEFLEGLIRFLVNREK